MLETIIRRKWYLQKHLDAPLLKERENYLAFMAEKRNYSHNYLLSLADYLLLIVTSLKLEDGFSEQVPISSIKDAAITWSKTKKNHPMKRLFIYKGLELEANINGYATYELLGCAQHNNSHTT